MRFTHLVLLAIAVLPCACLDMPITHIDKTRDPVVDPDAGDGGTDPQGACFSCMAAPDEPGPGCEASFGTCMQNEKCAIIINCGFEKQCFQGSRKAFLGCGLPCLALAGVIIGDDPVLTLASNLFQCLANGPCGDICFSSE
jgi:hypothetical protein